MRRVVVDVKGKLRPQEIRTSSVTPSLSPGTVGDKRRSPSVIARLMGLEALQHGPTGQGQ